MKIWCEECEGIGTIAKFVRLFFKNEKWVTLCINCKGKGYIDEPESVSMSFTHYKELKMAASKWRMIKWAIEKQVKFIAIPYDKDKPWATHINNDDIDMLIELYREMKQDE